ncbi:phosphatidylglycerophosphatase [Chromatiales bacterium (ex Bugula neritina AB1)]|nr:phosphatidylglycerophosphatase [Chromatiales bacterium (ex Bugula neritina AB1)]
MATSRRLTVKDLVHSPASFLALGFGTGLAPRAPGTVGTLPGVLLCVLIADQPLLNYLFVVLVALVVGLWVCGSTSRQLGTHDHGGIVWDEIVGFLVAMFAVPVSAGTLLAGFVMFRVFDILKPWPIKWLDSNISGGPGIMIDDLAAGAAACVCLHAMLKFFPALLLW